MNWTYLMRDQKVIVWINTKILTGKWKKNNCTGYQKSYDERSKLLAMFIKSYDWYQSKIRERIWVVVWLDVSWLTFADSWPHSLLSRHHFFFSRNASPSSCNFKICKEMQLLQIASHQGKDDSPWIMRHIWWVWGDNHDVETWSKFVLIRMTPMLMKKFI